MSMTHEQVFKRLMAWQHLRLGACWIEFRVDQFWCVGTDKEGLVDAHDDLHHAIDHFLTLVDEKEIA